MSDEETFESADAGSAGCIPMKCGDLRKGSFVVIKGKPCKVEEITTSKTGKHGHAKANYYGYDIFTHKRYEDCEPTTHNVMVPVVTRTEYILTDINEDDQNDEGHIVTLMTEGGEQREDLRLPTGDAYDNLRAAFTAGDKEVWITVVNAMDINMIDSQFVLKDIK